MKSEKERQTEKLFKKLCRKVGKTIREYEMVKENDSVLVGLSGGKDSMLMLEFLSNLKKKLPFTFSLFVAHVIPENTGYSVNLDSLNEFCNELGLSLITRKILIQPDNNKATCFVCSWHRRKALFDLTREFKCNKLAMGHHRDDALQTLLMNMLYHGSISSLPYQLKMFDGRVHLIRPMMDLWEKDLKEMARLKEFKTIEKSCPHEDITKRSYTSGLLEKIEADYPSAKTNMFHSLDNIYNEYLPKVKKRSG